VGGGPGAPGGGAGEGPGHRSQELALTPQQELRLGEKAYRQVLEEAGDAVLPARSPEVQRVQRVAEKILKAAHIRALDQEINLHIDWEYIRPEFNVIRKREVNAFCLPGGKIVVFTGLLRVVGDNDAFLATVLSHEIAHALAHHTSERLAMEPHGQTFRGLRFERAQESEADHIGVFLMTFAGYDPREAPRFWERMEQMTGGSGTPEILSNHPSDEHRMRALQQWARAAAAAKQAYDEGRVAPAARD
jgi:predicted Zn-dependent protease